MNMKCIPIVIAISLSSLTTIPTFAGTCTISGQSLLTAYTYAKNSGLHFLGEAQSRTGKRKPLYVTKSGKLYTVPGKIGIKGRAPRPSKISAYFFKGHGLKHGWKISSVRHGSNPTGAFKYITSTSTSTKINLVSTDKLSIGKSYDYFITRIVFKNAKPSKTCGNDLVTQQMALRDIFGS